MSPRLLLDEMLSDDLARQLRAHGHDVVAAVADPKLVGLPDSAVLAHATAEARVVVTRNIKDFIGLDAQYRAGSSTHAGIVLISTKTFPQDRSATGALVQALEKFLTHESHDPGGVVFLQR